MALDTTTIIAAMPEFASIADATRDVYIALAMEEMDSTAWGELYNQGVAYLAAHKMLRMGVGSSGVIGGGAGAAGMVTAETAGKVSRSYGSAASASVTLGEQEYTTTKYGMQYLALLRRLDEAGPGYSSPLDDV